MMHFPLRGDSVRFKAVALLTFSLAATLSSSAFAVDCQKDFTALMSTRQQIIARINGFNKKKPSAQLACQVLTELGNSDKRTLSWLETNKQWCQIPDEVPNGLKQQTAQSSTIRVKACGAAQAQAKQIQQLKRQQEAGAGGPSSLPGSGIRLPQGAL